MSIITQLVRCDRISSNYLRYFQDKKLYFFLLGLTASVGDIDIILFTLVFILTMALSYKIKYQSFYQNYSGFINNLNHEYRKLFYSILTAGGFSLSSYLILNIWTELDNKWLALGIISQILLSGIGLIFLTGILLKNKDSNQIKNNILDEIINQLDSPSPLKRLWAINQIISQWHHQRFTIEEYEQIQDYLTILRDLETETIIINKIDEYLNLMSPILSNPLQMPIKSFVYQKQTLKIKN